MLVVRAWLEDGRAEDLRARISCTPDVDRRETTVVSAAGDAEVEDVVRRWLAALLAGDGPMTPE